MLYIFIFCFSNGNGCIVWLQALAVLGADFSRHLQTPSRISRDECCVPMCSGVVNRPECKNEEMREKSTQRACVPSEIGKNEHHELVLFLRSPNRSVFGFFII